MTEEYVFRQVGVKRHPELYGHETLTAPVFDTVEKELEMWKAAEEIAEIYKKHQFTIPQQMFIFHFVNNLTGMAIDSMEELKWFEWMKFRLTMSRIFDVLNSKELLGKNYGTPTH
jgi:hypothetical protein